MGEVKTKKGHRRARFARAETENESAGKRPDRERGCAQTHGRTRTHVANTGGIEGGGGSYRQTWTKLRNLVGSGI